jgi:hypothetical protein
MAVTNLLATLAPSPNPMAYEVSVNDGGIDGGNDVHIVIYSGGAGYSSYLGEANVQNAVEAFAASLDAVSGFTLLSVKKVELVETVI